MDICRDWYELNKSKLIHYDISRFKDQSNDFKYYDLEQR